MQGVIQGVGASAAKPCINFHIMGGCTRIKRLIEHTHWVGVRSSTENVREKVRRKPTKNRMFAQPRMLGHGKGIGLQGRLLQ